MSNSLGPHGMDCSPPGSSVHEISQARILECVVISFSRESSWPKDQIHISCIAGRFFTTKPQGKPRYIELFTIRNSIWIEYAIIYYFHLWEIWKHFNITMKGRKNGQICKAKKCEIQSVSIILIDHHWVYFYIR